MTQPPVSDAGHGNIMAVLKGSSEYGTQRKWNPKKITLLACPECSDYHQTKQSLLRHRRDIHGFVPDFQCQLCSVILTEPEEIKQHIAKHEAQKSYECGVCEKTFTTSTSLVRHMRYKHTNEKLYKCNICGFSAVEHHKLQIHIRTHTGEAPFCCVECGATFKSKVSLTRHKATHSDTREYMCTLCFQQFSISNTLRNHLRLVHKVDNAFLDGMKNSLLHGIPIMLKKFFISTGQKLDDFGKVRYYDIKEEYTSNLERYFQEVSPLLLTSGDSYSEAANTINQELDKKKSGTGIIPTLGRRKRKNRESLNSSENEKGKTMDNVMKRMIGEEDFKCVDRDGIQENREYEYAFIDPSENGLDTELEEAAAQDYSFVKVKVLCEESERDSENIIRENWQERVAAENIESIPIENILELTEDDQGTTIIDSHAQHIMEENEEVMDISDKHQETILDEHEEAISDEHQEAILDEHQEAISDELQEAISDEHQKDISEKHQEAISEKHQKDISDEHQEAISDEHQEAISDEHRNTISEKQQKAISEKHPDTETSPRKQIAQTNSDYGSETVTKDICIPIKSNEQLKKMKDGTFGKSPQVIEVLADGSILDVTDNYSRFLPQSI